MDHNLYEPRITTFRCMDHTDTLKLVQYHLRPYIIDIIIDYKDQSNHIILMTRLILKPAGKHVSPLISKATG